MTELESLEARLGVTFNDPSLLQQSLVHRSYVNENPETSLADNERLEFLGDALLGLVVAEELYRRFPHLSEGQLTRMRSSLVRKESLARVSAALNLGDYLLLGRGEEASGGRQRPTNLSRVLEAVLGATLLDQGFAAAQGVVLRLFADALEHLSETRLVADPKSRLQELVQSKWQVTPVYHTVAEEGPDHSKLFTVEVMAGGDVLGRGVGRSKQSAEKEAAKAALRNLAEG